MDAAAATLDRKERLETVNSSGLAKTIDNVRLSNTVDAIGLSENIDTIGLSETVDTIGLSGLSGSVVDAGISAIDVAGSADSPPSSPLSTAKGDAEDRLIELADHFILNNPR